MDFAEYAALVRRQTNEAVKRTEKEIAASTAAQSCREETEMLSKLIDLARRVEFGGSFQAGWELERLLAGAPADVVARFEELGW